MIENLLAYLFIKYRMTDKEIYNPFLSVALSASAGSGKTHALTTRLITMLLSGIGPSEILAITFTNLAAHEIRKKLFDRVQAIVKGDEKEVVLFTDILKEKPEIVIEKALNLKTRLIKQFSLIQISTIHSFFARIVRNFPKETGYVFDISVIDEIMEKSLAGMAIEQFFGGLEKDEVSRMRFYNFIFSCRGTRLTTASTIRKIYNEVDSKYYVLKDLITREDRLNEVEREFRKRKAFLLSYELESRINLLIEVMSEFINKYGENRNIESFIRNLESFLRYRNIRILMELTPFTRDVESGMVNYLGKVCKTLHSDEAGRFEGALSDIRASIISYLYAEMEYFIHSWIEIYRKINRYLCEIKKDAQAVDFSDIEYHALDLLSGLTDFEYFNFRTGSRFRYILIDEFQDTSKLQWDALNFIVRNSLLNNGNLFYVGDLKQSIYRWRGGEPWLFEKVLSDLSISKKYLTYSYRQSSALLGFVNTVFKNLKEGIFPSYPYEKQSLQPEKEEEKQKGYVRVTQYDERSKLVDEVANQIIILQKLGVNLSDIAVLCRKNSEIEEIEKSLLKNGISYISIGKSKLLGDYSVMDVVNIINFVLNPGEEIYLAGLLRSPIFRFTYEGLNRCRLGKGRVSLQTSSPVGVAPAPAGRRPGKGKVSLQGLAETRPGLYNTLTSLLLRSHYLSPSGFLRSVYEEFAVLNAYPHKREALLALYEFAYTFENTGGSITLYDFANYLQDNSQLLSLNMSEEGGVRLLTVHSAKGLEFHSVIMPFLSQPFKFRPDNSLLFLRDDGGKTNCYAIAKSSYETYFSNYPGIPELFKETDLNYKIDELNILYVALTRAEKNLVILPLANRGGMSIGDVLISSFDVSRSKGDGLYNIEIGKPAVSPLVRQAGEKIYDTDGLKYPKSKIKPGRPDESSLFSDKRAGGTRLKRVGLLKGLIFHRSLEMIKRLPVAPKALDDILRRALALEGSKYTKSEREEAVKAARVSISNAVADKRITKYFSEKAVAEAVSLSLSYKNFIGRIDRIRIDRDVEVIDFKTNRVSGDSHLDDLVKHYRNQVVSYCQSLNNIYPDKPVRGYLYFTEVEYDRRLVSVYQEGTNGHFR